MRTITWICSVFTLLVNLQELKAQDGLPDSAKVRQASQLFVKKQIMAKALLAKRVEEAQQEYLKELNELSEDYKSILEKEQKDTTKSGDLEEALKIKKLADEFDSSLKHEQAMLSVPVASNSLTTLESKLEGTTWKFPSGEKMTLQKNGEGEFPRDGRKFQWGAISEKEVVFRYLKTNYVDLFEFDLEKNKCTVRGIGYVGRVTKSGELVP